MLSDLEAYVAGHVWLAAYPVRYAGTRFDARMTVLRLGDGRLMIHSPGPLEARHRAQLEDLGEVAFIVAPGNFHHLHVARAQQLFPAAETWIFPGVERKQPSLRFTGVLGERPPAAWAADLDQALVRGRIMGEVALLHRASRTLVLVDLIENFGDHTPGLHWLLRVYWKAMRMWNRPRPAPEYRLAWGDRAAARASLERVLSWDFERIVLAHGALVEGRAHEVAREAWRGLLDAGA